MKLNGFLVVTTNLSALGCPERAEVIGFRSHCSAMIEAKVSGADFVADLKKPHRLSDGIGLYRFHICPSSLTSTEKLSSRWELLHVHANRITEIARPCGNISPKGTVTIAGWTEWQHEIDQDAERNVLFSIPRRLALGKPLMRCRR